MSDNNVILKIAIERETHKRCEIIKIDFVANNLLGRDLENPEIIYCFCRNNVDIKMVMTQRE